MDEFNTILEKELAEGANLQTSIARTHKKTRVYFQVHHL